MEPNPQANTPPKSRTRRVIVLVAVVGILILMVVAAASTSSESQPIGATYLGPSDSATPQVLLSNRTDRRLYAAVSLQYKNIDKWAEWEATSSGGVDLASHATVITTLATDPPKTARLHLRVQNLLPDGLAGIGPRLRLYWYTRQISRTSGVPMSRMPNAFLPGMLGVPKDCFIRFDTMPTAPGQTIPDPP